ncbi:MAG TPA: hypothetical protein VLA92_00555, partial [Candidatus Saccharimonadales bacterium]|nr:hypothetical protein [Candidatus Saccharimonadales bacterium]
ITEVEQQGSFVADHITQIIRNADSITTPAAGASTASLTLAVPTTSLSPTIFDLSSGVVRVKEGTAAVVPLTSDKVEVSNVTFTNLTRASTPGIVQVKFTVSRVNPNSKNEYDYQKTFTVSAALRK